jgi:hypothetical protein
MFDEIQTAGNNKPNINNPHDKGYKYLLFSGKVFPELLQSFVNLSWVQQIGPFWKNWNRTFTGYSRSG